MTGCRACGKKVERYAVIHWKDKTFWCTSECWNKQMNEEKAKEAERQRFLKTRITLIHPGEIR